MNISISGKNNLVEQNLAVSLIRRDININPRKELDKENIASLMKVDIVPPVILGYCESVDVNGLVVIDGYHRVETRILRGDETIACYVLKYDNIDEMKKDAFIRNATHGKKLNDFEIAIAINDMKKYYERTNVSFSFESIGKETGLGHRKIRGLLAWVEVSETVNDSTISMSAADCLYKYIVAGEKDKLIEVWTLYSTLPVKDLREAIKCFDEGKNYFQEKLVSINESIDTIEETVANPMTEEEIALAGATKAVSESLNALGKSTDKSNALMKISLQGEIKAIKGIVKQKLTAIQSIIENNKMLTNPIKIDTYAKFRSDLDEIVSDIDEICMIAQSLWEEQEEKLNEIKPDKII